MKNFTHGLIRRANRYSPVNGMGRLRVCCLALMLLGCLAHPTPWAQQLDAGSYLWYLPEHERPSRTTFYAAPNFGADTVTVSGRQRFRLLGEQSGWASLEFDQAGRAFVHMRILRNMLYNPLASDLAHEYNRASVFRDDPAKVAATLKNPNAEAPTTPSSSGAASWRRYKDSWNVTPARPTQRAYQQKPLGGGPLDGKFGERRKAPSLLPPIGSDPDTEPSEPGASAPR